MIVDARNVNVVELKLGTASKVTNVAVDVLHVRVRVPHCHWCVSVRKVGNDPETIVVQLSLGTFRPLDVAPVALRHGVLKTCVFSGRL